MDEWIEIEGRNRQDAIERACNALNTNPSHLRYEVLHQGNGVRIRAMKIEAGQPPSPDRRPPREVPDQQSEGARDEEERDDDLPPLRVQDDRVGRPDRAGRSGRGGRPDRGGRGTRDPRGGRDVPPPREPQRARNEDNDREEARGGETVEREELPPPDPEAGKRAREMLETIVRHIDETAEVDLKETEDAVYLDIRAERGGLLIGKYGQTLSALQYLVARMVGLDRSRGRRLVLDSEQYLARRQESLESLAKKLADKVARTGRSAGADPMSAADRRIIHMALADDPDVTTRSVGEGPNRRVLIVPRGSGDDDRQDDRDGARSDDRGGYGRGPRRGGGRSLGGRGRGGSGRGPYRGREDAGVAARDDDAAPRRRSGPPPRKHDSFDTPPDPDSDLFEEDPEAPIMTEADREASAVDEPDDHDDEPPPRDDDRND
jgi:spoIIIJ-associated protein